MGAFTTPGAIWVLSPTYLHRQTETELAEP